MIALGTPEPLAFLFVHHFEVTALYAIWASDGIWHGVSGRDNFNTQR
jgi:hypothetical protein